MRRLLSILAIYNETEEAGGGRERHDAQCLRYFQFVQGVDEAWIGMLEGRDVRCLVVYGWWMSVVGKCGHWWARVRGRREGEGVVRWLDGWCCGEVERGYDGGGGVEREREEGDEREEVKPWLGFMAEAVGYRLRSR